MYEFPRSNASNLSKGINGAVFSSLDFEKVGN
jgi:hypothetical protein